MTCEEFQAIGLGLERQVSIGGEAEGAERAGAIEHANSCPRCAALQESWQEARVGLQALREATRKKEAPPRVEMRLRQEFRTKHRTLKARGRLIFGAWTLATAALLVAFVSWWNWHLTHSGVRHSIGSIASGANPRPAVSGKPGINSNDAEDSANQAPLLADNEGDFTLLPGSLPQETQDAAIFQVRLQRRALGALGLPVNEERAADWIQVDLLVGEDGQPRAVRLPEEISR